MMEKRMKFKIGINLHRLSTKFLSINLEGLLRKYDELGFKVVEVPSELELLTNLSSYNEAERKLMKVLKVYGFDYTVHAPLSVTLSGNLEEFIDRVSLSVNLARKLESKVVVMHVESRKDEGFGEISNRLSKVASVAEEHGVSLALENAQPASNDKRWCFMKNLVKLVKEVGLKSVGITLDVGHLFLSSSYLRFSFTNSIDESLPYLLHLHLSDNYGKFNPANTDDPEIFGDLHLPPGEGNVPYEDVIRLIKRNYRGVYLLDVRPSHLEKLRRSLEFLNNVLHGNVNKRD